MASMIMQASIDLQDRDFLILRGLFESRVMTLAHIASLFFDGKAEAAKKRMQKLKAAGYVRERPRRPYEPSVLFLTRAAFTLLSEHGDLSDYPRIGITSLEKRAQVSGLTIRHELEVTDVKAALVSAIGRLANFRVAEFSTWPLLCQFSCPPPTHGGFHAAEMIVKPDGLIRIHEQDETGISEHAFFLEVDRSTETQDVLMLRAACYGSYYRSGGFAVRCGGEQAQFAEYPFRVLMVFKTAERRNNTAERMLQSTPPIYTQVWLTTMSEIVIDPLGTIWVRPIDYERCLLRGTPLNSTGQNGRPSYRRHVGRDLFVNADVPKRALLQTD